MGWHENNIATIHNLRILKIHEFPKKTDIIVIAHSHTCALLRDLNNYFKIQKIFQDFKGLLLFLHLALSCISKHPFIRTKDNLLKKQISMRRKDFQESTVMSLLNILQIQ